MINIRGELKTGVLLHVANKYKMFPKKFNNLPDCCKFSLIQEYADTLEIYIKASKSLDGYSCQAAITLKHFQSFRSATLQEAQVAAIEKLTEIVNQLKTSNMTKENNFTPIPGYDGYYEINKSSAIRSVDREMTDSIGKTRKLKGRIRKPQLKKRGYYAVDLKKEGVNKRFTVHQLMAITFLDHKPCGFKLVVDHINGNKLDNRLFNLRVVTMRENVMTHRKGSSKYKGVSWCRKTKKWRSVIWVKDKNIWLGNHTNEIDAHNAYQKHLNYILS